MQLFAMVVVQLFAVVLLAGTSIQSGSAQVVRRSVKQVLGISYLAQDIPPEAPPPDQPQNTDNNAAPPEAQSTTEINNSQPQSSSSDQTPAAQPDSSVPSLSPENQVNSPVIQSLNDESGQPLKTDETSLINDTPRPTKEQSAQITPFPAEITPEQQTQEAQQKNLEETVNTESGNDTLPLVNQTLTDSKTLINKPEKIDESAINKAAQEDKQIEEIKDPQQQTKSLINFAKDKVVELNQQISGDDFSTSLFLVGRLADQIDKARENMGRVDSADRKPIEQQLKTFCKQADLGLKTEQLVVPEDLEQDFEIARGSCLATQ